MSLMQELKLPNFTQFDAKQIPSQLEQQLANSKQAIAALLQQSKPSYQQLVPPLEQIDDAIGELWGPLSHLHSVANTDEVREAYDACLPLVTEFSTWLSQNETLYSALQQLADSDEFAQLNQAQQQDIELQLRDFRLAGVALSAADKQAYAQLKQELAQLSAQFSNQLMDATDAWSMQLDNTERLQGLPESALAQAQQLAQSKDQQGYMLNLDFACYFAVMSFADDRELRRSLYEAFNTRASDQGPHAGKYDNSSLMEELVSKRHALANLVGFDNYADYSVASKMADSGDQVLGFLEDLAQQCKPLAEQEMAQLQAFASEQGGPQLEAWDVGYYSEKLRQARYDLSQEALKPYFALPKVQAGLFAIVERLFGIQVEAVGGVPTWHDDVSFYRISRNGNAVGYFYFDLFAREQKRGGAWMNDCRGRQVLADGQQQLPVAYLVCNFAPATADKPALLTHSDVVTLFHEFGHGLHHMLTNISVAGVSGINGVPWDAVELPSQMLENWAWEKESLMMFARHYETDELLPADLLQKMLAAKHFQSAMFMVRQLEFGLFDLRLHRHYDADAPQSVQQVLDQVRQQVAVVSPPSWNRFQHGFAHIFAGGYSAGYYSYMWADVLAADVFERFLADGIFNQQTGQDYWQKLLGQGGSKGAMALFVDFMGREPDVAALIRSKGLQAA